MAKMRTINEINCGSSVIIIGLHAVLENELLHHRFTSKGLDKKLQELVPTVDSDVTVRLVWKVDQTAIDYQCLAVLKIKCLDEDGKPIEMDFGYIDIYYLKARKNNGDDPNKIYVTEIAVSVD